MKNPTNFVAMAKYLDYPYVGGPISSAATESVDIVTTSDQGPSPDHRDEFIWINQPDSPAAGSSHRSVSAEGPPTLVESPRHSLDLELPLGGDRQPLMNEIVEELNIEEAVRPVSVLAVAKGFVYLAFALHAVSVLSRRYGTTAEDGPNLVNYHHVSFPTSKIGRHEFANRLKSYQERVIPNVQMMPSEIPITSDEDYAPTKTAAEGSFFFYDDSSHGKSALQETDDDTGVERAETESLEEDGEPVSHSLLGVEDKPFEEDEEAVTSSLLGVEDEPGVISFKDTWHLMASAVVMGAAALYGPIRNRL